MSPGEPDTHAAVNPRIDENDRGRRVKSERKSERVREQRFNSRERCHEDGCG